jgi:hypothetical protein
MAFSVLFFCVQHTKSIWLEYLDRHLSDPNAFVILMGAHEIAEQLKAQNEYVGMRVMRDLGFTQRMVKASKAKDRNVQARIREVAREAGWDISRGLFPTMFFMAKKVDRLKEFQFLYSATSRFVHFSPQELMRRAWGRPGALKLSSETFGGYWETFAIYWGFRIFLNLLIHCHDLLTSIDETGSKYEEMHEWLKEFRPVPIITREELEWPAS